jgi:16S rRNA (guanine(527)-N(7))-methyltransferase GidB
MMADAKFTMESEQFCAAMNAVIERGCLSNRVKIPDGAGEKLHALVSYMLEYNAHTNLTAITDAHQIITRHIIDSLTISSHVPANSTFADIGSGAGFPSLPLAIVREDVSITAMESISKKCIYMETAASKLALSNVKVINARAEEAAYDSALREGFDIVTARAVSSLDVICELCLPFVKIGGAFVAMKSKVTLDEELAKAKNAVKTLGGEIETRDEFDIPEIDSDEKLGRALIIIRKIENTDKKYPRKYSQITRKPL